MLLLLVASTCVYRSDSLKVRFDNGSEYEGRVDIYHNGTLGSVCDFGWDLNDIQFMCKELSFEPQIDDDRDEACYYGSYLEDNNTIWFESVNCSDTEFILEQCSHDEWNSTNEQDA